MNAKYLSNQLAKEIDQLIQKMHKLTVHNERLEADLARINKARKAAEKRVSSLEWQLNQREIDREVIKCVKDAEPCPECESGHIIPAIGGGVVCDKGCGYWFCY